MSEPKPPKPASLFRPQMMRYLERRAFGLPIPQGALPALWTILPLVGVVALVALAGRLAFRSLSPVHGMSRALIVVAALSAALLAAMVVVWRRRRARLPMIFQSESAECSLACVAMLAGYHGHAVGLPALRQLYTASLRGLSLRSVVSAAATVGLRARVLRCDVDELRHVARPAMLHWNGDHFVVLRAGNGKRFVIHDPAAGVRTIDHAELNDHFSGVVMELHPTPDFRRSKAAARLGMGQLIGRLGDLKWALAQILVLSAVVEVLTLLPVVMAQAIVDVGLIQRDHRFLLRATLVLVAVALLRAGSSFLRDRRVVDAGTTLNLRMAQRLFRYTLSLPLGFFEKRPIGMLIERYRVADEIERFFAGSFPLALIDGCMAMLSIVLVFWISTGLGLLSLLTVVLHFIVRAVGHQSRRAHEARAIWAKGEEHGHVIETLDTIFTSKAAAIEDNRYNVWLGFYGKLVGAQRKLGVVDAGYRAFAGGLAAVNAALFLLIGGAAVAGDRMSIGMLLAATVYNGQFFARAVQLVDRLHEYRLLAVRLELLEDIVHTAPEEGAALLDDAAEARPPRLERRLAGAVSVDRLSFRYGADQPLILRDASFVIRPGELVAIVGHNGAGKTTLLKLLLGLYPPVEGRIGFDGQELKTWSLSSLRRQIGLVTQDDQLLTGTIAQNIALFDPELDMERVVAVAQLASVHADIDAMPLKYTTGVGELGSPFSEGQRQKVLLARALYRDPAILMMDEGTANLDTASEVEVLDNLARLPATKILIAHRPATLERADRVLLVEDGVVNEVSRAAAQRALSRSRVVDLPTATQPLMHTGQTGH